jgi:hypothetical protein
MKISSSTIATLAIAATAIGGSAFAVTLNTPVSGSNQSTNLQTVVDPLAPVGEIIIDTATPVPPVDGTTPVLSPTPVAPAPKISASPDPVDPIVPEIPSYNSGDDDDEEYGNDDDYGYEDEDDDYGYESEHESYDDEDDD